MESQGRAFFKETREEATSIRVLVGYIRHMSLNLPSLVDPEKG